MIAQVGRDSPAERAGLQSGDVIVTFDGEPIETSADLPHVVGLIAPGSRVQALIARDGEEQSVTVEVGALAADQVARVVRSIRQIELKKSPSVSETLDWAKTLVLLGVEKIDEQTASQTINILLKYQSDINKALKELATADGVSP